MQAGIRHPNPPPPRGPDKLAASRSPGTHLEAQENEVPRIKPAPDAAGLPFRSSRRSSGLDTGGLDLWPPLLGLATSHARRRERDASFFSLPPSSLCLFFSLQRGGHDAEPLVEAACCVQHIYIHAGASRRSYAYGIRSWRKDGNTPTARVGPGHHRSRFLCSMVLHEIGFDHGYSLMVCIARRAMFLM
jgi:hypothetical protein